MGTPVLVARFTLPGEALLRRVEGTARAGPCIVAIRDAHLPRSPAHPFTWQERARLLRDALPPGLRASLAFAALREYEDPARQAGDVRALADGAPIEVASDGVPVAGELFGCDTPELAASKLSPLVPAAIAAALPGLLRGADYPRLQAEWRQIAHEQQQWSVAPYPVVLVTVDAVVHASDHVLLVRRGRMPGQGLFALPGGFLEPAEWIRDAAIRELVEETRLDLSLVQGALRGARVFDDPQRSQRGRVVTHAHFFDLGERALPVVQGGDDAASAEWVPLARIPSLEAQLMDDHLRIIDHFLALDFPPPRVTSPDD